MTLWDKRLLVVAGKGGVGRTTISVLLALAAAAHGKRAAVIELDGMSGVADLWELPARSYTPQGLAPGAETISMSPLECLDDFGKRRLKLNSLVRLVFHNRVMSAFLDAVPGMNDMLQLGKVENLVVEPAPHDPHYDVLVLDAPATGHGLTLLSAARSMTEMTRRGPFFDLARGVEELMSDPARTGLVLVTLPEELPVNEAIDLLEQLGPDRTLLQALVVNQALRNPLPPGVPWARLREALDAHDHPSMVPLLRLADAVADRHRVQARVLERLRETVPGVFGAPLPVVEVRRVPGGPDRQELGALAGELRAAVDGGST